MKSNTFTKALTCLIFILCMNASQVLFAIDYQIELIVFEHLNSSPSPEGEPRIGEFDDYPNLIQFNEVQTDKLVLSEEAKKIRGSRNFRLLKHFAWSQEGLSQDEAGAVNLARWVPGVKGKAAVFLSRYLHLDIEIEKYNEEGVTYTLSERRRMRSNETHYLDNPQIGIIARITPLKDIA